MKFRTRTIYLRAKNTFWCVEKFMEKIDSLFCRVNHISPEKSVKRECEEMKVISHGRLGNESEVCCRTFFIVFVDNETKKLGLFICEISECKNSCNGFFIITASSIKSHSTWFFHRNHDSHYIVDFSMIFSFIFTFAKMQESKQKKSEFHLAFPFSEICNLFGSHILISWWSMSHLLIWWMLLLRCRKVEWKWKFSREEEHILVRNESFQCWVLHMEEIWGKWWQVELKSEQFWRIFEGLRVVVLSSMMLKFSPRFLLSS